MAKIVIKNYAYAYPDLKNKENEILDIIKNENERRLENDEDPIDFKFTQIKEKYGSLCLYNSGCDDEMYGMISFAESMSERICEICGTSVDNGYTGEAWVYNCCKKCFDEKIKPENAYLEWKPIEK